MPPHETYSERKRRLAKAGQADVYRYDILPERLRIQIVHIWTRGIGSGATNASNDRYTAIRTAILESEGRLYLLGYRNSSIVECQHWLQTSSVDQALDIIEVSCAFLSADLIEEINYRMKQNGVGYQIEQERIIRVDDQFAHAEVVKPAIGLLTSDPAYQTAAEEFLMAHEHHRHDNNKDAVVAANRAFESTLKAICHQHKWDYEKGARASDLIKVVRQHGLFPEYLDKTFDTYIAMMKSGLPEVRNNAGGHGAAPSDAEVPSYVAAYAIHLSALNIVLAIEAEKALQ